MLEFHGTEWAVQVASMDVAQAEAAPQVSEPSLEPAAAAEGSARGTEPADPRTPRAGASAEESPGSGEVGAADGTANGGVRSPGS